MLKDAPKVVYTGLAEKIGSPKDFNASQEPENKVDLTIPVHLTNEKTPQKSQTKEEEFSTSETMKEKKVEEMEEDIEEEP